MLVGLEGRDCGGGRCPVTTVCICISRIHHYEQHYYCIVPSVFKDGCRRETARRAVSVETVRNVAKNVGLPRIAFGNPCNRRMTFKVIKGHWKWHELIYNISYLCRIATTYVYLAPFLRHYRFNSVWGCRLKSSVRSVFLQRCSIAYLKRPSSF